MNTINQSTFFRYCFIYRVLLVLIECLISYTQGAKVAAVSSQDLIKILTIHAKMSPLRHAAGSTHVEIDSGEAVVVARAVEGITCET